MKRLRCSGDSIGVVAVSIRSVNERLLLPRITQVLMHYAGTLAAWAGAVAGGAVAGWSFFSESRFAILGTSVFAVCVGHLASRRRILRTETACIRVAQAQRVEPRDVLFCALLSATWLLWYAPDHQRSLFYFIFVSALVGSIVPDAFQLRDRGGAIALVKTVVVALTIRYGHYYAFPSLAGYDAYGHAGLAEQILWLGRAPIAAVADQYAVSIGLHAAVASLSGLASLGVKDSTFVLCGGLLPVVQTLVLFNLGRRLHSPSAGIMAALLGAVTTSLLLRSVANVTPGSIVLVYFLLVWLAVTFSKRSATTHAVVLLFMLAAVVTHQLTPFVMLICLFTYWCALCLVGRPEGVGGLDLGLVLLFSFMLVVSWNVTPGYREDTFWEVQLRVLAHVLVSGGRYDDGLLLVGLSQGRSWLEETALQLGTVAPLLLGIAGGLFSLERKSSPIYVALGLTVLVLLVLVYLPVAVGVQSFLTERWLPILACVWLPLAGVWLVSSCSNRWCSSGIGRGVPVVALALFAFVSITLPIVNKDNPFIAKESTVRNQFIVSELTAARWSLDAASDLVTTDAVFANALRYEQSHAALRDGAGSTAVVHGSLLIDSTDRYSNSLNVLRNAVFEEPMPQETELAGMVTKSRVRSPSIEAIRAAWDGVIYSSASSEVGIS